MIDDIKLTCSGAHPFQDTGVDYYIVTRSNHFFWLRDEQHKWCVETFGKAGDFSSSDICRWYHNGSLFYFLNKADCTWFLIRWA